MDKILYNEIAPKDDVFSKEIVDVFFGKSRKPSDSKKTPPKRPYYKIFLFGLVLLVMFACLAYYLVNANLPNKKNIVTTYGDSYNRLLYNGIFDRAIIKSLSFEGDAKQESIILRNSIKLVNKERLGWARATFKLNNYQDFSNTNLLISGKSGSGRKFITLILRDTQGGVYEIPRIRFSPNWEQKSIEMISEKGFDVKRVDGISIEYGTQATGNTNGAIIYIKEIGLRKGGV
ncbi:MAG: hypothetical protein V3U02_06525 [Calditrichia bacterium]